MTKKLDEAKVGGGLSFHRTISPLTLSGDELNDLSPLMLPPPMHQSGML